MRHLIFGLDGRLAELKMSLQSTHALCQGGELVTYRHFEFVQELGDLLHMGKYGQRSFWRSSGEGRDIVVLLGSEVLTFHLRLQSLPYIITIYFKAMGERVSLIFLLE